MSDIFVDGLGEGTPVVLVHGSLATSADCWPSQRSLAEEGLRLLMLDRRGYGRSAGPEGEDFLRDADDIVELLGDGAHLVGHSYGGLGALLAAARQPGDALLDAARARCILSGPAPSRNAGARRRGSRATGWRRFWTPSPRGKSAGKIIWNLAMTPTSRQGKQAKRRRRPA